MLIITSSLRLKARHVIQASGSTYPDHWVIAPDAWRAPALAHCFAGENESTLLAAAPEMLEALEYVSKVLGTARGYFPKSIRNSDRFQLENACATVVRAIHHARGAALKSG